MTTTESDIFGIVLDVSKGTLSVTLNWIILLVFIILFFIIKFILNKVKNRGSIDTQVIPVELNYKLGGASVKYQITRNYINVEVAHKIYIELITRKAALEIEEDKDVIVEVYNSWYTLFNITREELRNITGDILSNNKTTSELENLLTDILNKGLRPHLTEYQSKFRKWYIEELGKDENKGKSPQEIQQNFRYYKELVASLKDVNRLLIEYSKQLNRIIKG